MSLSATDADYLRAVVMRNSGNHVDPVRNYLFESRLQRVLRMRGMESLDQLVHALRRESGSALQRSVAEAMTINETSFFSDTASFEVLRAELLPSLIAARRDARVLRFWSAASFDCIGPHARTRARFQARDIRRHPVLPLQQSRASTYRESLWSPASLQLWPGETQRHAGYSHTWDFLL